MQQTKKPRKDIKYLLPHKVEPVKPTQGGDFVPQKALHAVEGGGRGAREALALYIDPAVIGDIKDRY
jgi:hypothetical protein